MTNFLWDLYQHQQIRDAKADARAAAESVGARADREMDRLRDRVDSLTLTNLAMWTLLRDKLGVKDEELEKRVRELDLLDGVQDGKLSAGPWNCEKCRESWSCRIVGVCGKRLTSGEREITTEGHGEPRT
jgi:hypothetical protein